MKQFQASWQDAESFREKVSEWQTWRNRNGAGQAFVHVFSDGAEEDEVRFA